MGLLLGMCDASCPARGSGRPATMNHGLMCCPDPRALSSGPAHPPSRSCVCCGLGDRVLHGTALQSSKSLKDSLQRGLYKAAGSADFGISYK